MQQYDYIVIGSGFGGSVSAMRLSEKGYSVAVLEKGREFQAKDFPKTNWSIRKYLWAPLIKCFGFQKITFFRRVMILSGTGVGGGSLVYANTLMFPPDEFFNNKVWSRFEDWKSVLSPFYKTAGFMLGVASNPWSHKADKVLRDRYQPYTNMRRPRISLVSYEVKELPSWVYKVSQDFELNFKKSSLLSKEEYLHSQVEQKISVSLSQRELAVLELIDELDLKNGFETVENYMNSLMTLRSSVLQEILENCKSIKVKRVFLYLSEKLELPYFYELNQAKIDIGSGKRVVVEGGKLDKKYNITVESEEEENPF